MNQLGTYDTKLQSWGRTKFAVMDKSGQIVFWAKSSPENAAAFHVFNSSSAGWKKVKKVEAFCEHEEGVYLQSLNVKSTEMLLVSCASCRKIRLYNMETGNVTTAFHKHAIYPGQMSPGDGDVLYVSHHVEGFPVLELNHPKQNPGSGKMIQSGMETYHSMHYIPAPHKLIVFSLNTESLIRAVSVVNGEVAWEVKGEIEGEICRPHGLLFSPDHQVLLVADGWNSRLIVLNPEDGSVLQTIQLDYQLGAIFNLCIHQQHLIVHHLHIRKQHKVLYYSIT